jgi:CHAT domain-containing protein
MDRVVHPMVLTGADATEARFKHEVAGHRVVHVASHGFFLSDQCAARTANLRGIGGLAAYGGRTTPVVDGDPARLLSGLVLAGANRRAETAAGEEDGILTAEEIAALDLRGVEWVVLSACETGLGQVQVGEGVFGLRRAFRVAGARTLIMSLWSVDDRATRAWMRTLYEGRHAGRLSTAESVRHAMLTTLRQGRASGRTAHPFFWAGFVAAGDWR